MQLRSKIDPQSILNLTSGWLANIDLIGQNVGLALSGAASEV